MRTFSRKKELTRIKYAIVFTLSIFLSLNLNATTIYVNATATGSNNGTSWANAYTSLQSALNTAVSGDSIFVKYGTYYPTTTGGNRDISFNIPSGVAVMGHFAGTEFTSGQRVLNNVAYETILSGDLNGDDNEFANNTENSKHVVTFTNVSSLTLLDGFTISHGNSDYKGGGILNNGSGGSNTSNPTIKNCLISYNNGGTYGGGIFNDCSGSSVKSTPIINSCKFYKNRTSDGGLGGAIYNNESRPIISNCYFERNFAIQGAAILNFNCCIDAVGPTITNCVFYNHIDWGTYDTQIGEGTVVALGGTLSLENCSFDDNHNHSKGAFYSNGAIVTITNCTFKNNLQQMQGSGPDVGGAAINSNGGIITLSGSVFENNTVGYHEETSALGIWRESWSGGAIYTTGTDLKVENSTFRGNETGKIGGAIYSNGGNIILSNNLFSGNRAAENGGALYLNANTSTTITNCTLSGNLAQSSGDDILYYNNPAESNGGAIYCKNSNPVIRNTIIWGNDGETSGDEIFNNSSTPSISYSNIKNCGNSGASWDLSIGSDAGNNISDYPFFVDSLMANNAPTTLGNYRLLSNSSCIDAGYNNFMTLGFDLDTTARIKNGTIDMGAFEWTQQVIYVKHDATGNNDGTSWANAYTSLQTALETVTANLDIYIARGTYKPSSAYSLTNTPRNYHFELVNNVSIYGGFAGTETLLSQRTDFGYGGANETILSGDIGTTGDNSDNCLHVVYNPTAGITNTALLEGVTITGGNANNGAVTNEKRGGAIYMPSNSPTISNVIITSNYANYGGGAFNMSSSAIYNNCLFFNNNAGYGGAVMNYSSTSLAFNNCTFYGNTATTHGGGVDNWSSALSYNNCVFWGNTSATGNQIYGYGNSTLTLNYSCFSNSSNDVATEAGSSVQTTNNNSTSNPLFINAAAYDFRLTGSSPCVNAGNNTYNTLSTDIRGQARIQNTTIDMGAYEWSSVDCIVTIPDANFKTELLAITGLDANSNGEIECSEAAAYTGTINVDNKGITDLTGIESFTNITHLICSNNSLIALNISANTALTNLDCSFNQLISLNASLNTVLQNLNCYSNSLTSLNVSGLTALTNLNCGFNQLSTLNLSTNSALQSLSCNNNLLTSLNTSVLTSLTSLECYSNPVLTLDVSTNTALNFLDCNHDQLSTLDVSSNTALETLYCYSNSITNLNVSGLSSLAIIDCGENQLSTLNLTTNTALQELYCYVNLITSIDVSGLPSLIGIDCNHNQLPTMDISTNSDLQWLICNNNLLTGLDISMNPSLGVLECQNNLLTSFNVKNGNNSNISGSDFDATNNPDLTCIQVDDVAYSTTNWTNKDAAASYNTNCTPTLQYTAGANGTISGTTSQTVYYGADGSLVTAVANSGYHFVNWSDANTQNPRTDLNVTASISVTANFDINTYTLEYSTGNDGIISGIANQTVNHGANGTAITAVPNTGYHFANWSDGSTINPRADSNVTANINVSANFAINTYIISASESPAVSGTITGTGTYNYGENITLTASAATGFIFSNWTENGSPVSSNSSYSFTVNANRTFVANFSASSTQYTISASVNPVNSGTITGDGNYNFDETAILTATANTGYTFVNWTEDGTEVSTDATFLFTVEGNRTLVANFSVNSYSLNYAAGANGSITGNANQTVSYNENGSEVTAVANSNYHFVDWSDGSTTNPRTDLNVMANISVSANFAINTYTLDYSANANGAISGTASQTVNYGTNGTEITAVPNTGYHFVNWSDGSTANPRTDSNITGNINVSANFAINTYTLDYSANANGAISGTASQTVNHSANGTEIIAVPNAGYHFVNWSDGSTANPRTDSNITANINVSANFAINTFTVDYTAGANGTITGTLNQTVNYSADGSEVTAVANIGYHFVNWSDASIVNPRTDLNVTANISVTANFAINTYTLTYTAGSNGTVSGIATQTVDYGSDGSEVTAVPNTGYHFVDWSDASIANPRTDLNVTANISVTANFAINTFTLDYTAGSNGTITGTLNQTVNYGEDGSEVAAVPNANYHFVDWSDGSTSNPRTDLNVTANIDVTANFASNTFTLDYTAGANGSITGILSQTVNYGADGSEVTAVPNTGYHFVDWSDSSTQNPRTDLNVTANISVTANFEITTSINENISILEIKVFPNPFSNKLIIELIGNNELRNFVILNTTGQSIYTGKIIGNTTVETSNFAPGFYLIKIENGKTFDFKKVIKE